ncbi:MAG: hypothetical protein ACI959_001670 [Limisphaerales bacterium]|jgi:hypothetical protein
MFDFIHEPDNEGLSFQGLRDKQGLHRYPFLTAQDKHPSYINIFKQAQTGNTIPTISKWNTFLFRTLNLSLAQFKIESPKTNYTPKRNLVFANLFFKLIPKSIRDDQSRLIKTVHAGLSIGFILSKLEIKPLIIFRHPASVISSYLYLKMADGDRKLYDVPSIQKDILANLQDKIEVIKDDKLALMGLQVSIFYFIMERDAAKFNIPIYFHENLCVNPVEKIKQVYTDFNIPWNTEIAEKITASNNEGSGFQTNRVASDQIDIWKKRLDAAQIKSIQKGFSILPVRAYSSFRI